MTFPALKWISKPQLIDILINVIPIEPQTAAFIEEAEFELLSREID